MRNLAMLVRTPLTLLQLTYQFRLPPSVLMLTVAALLILPVTLVFLTLLVLTTSKPRSPSVMTLLDALLMRNLAMLVTTPLTLLQLKYQFRVPPSVLMLTVAALLLLPVTLVSLTLLVLTRKPRSPSVMTLLAALLMRNLAMLVRTSLTLLQLTYQFRVPPSVLRLTVAALLLLPVTLVSLTLLVLTRKPRSPSVMTLLAALQMRNLAMLVRTPLTLLQLIL